MNKFMMNKVLINKVSINMVSIFALLLLAMGCKEKFISPAPPVVTGFLVVEGVLDNQGGSTTIRLSRTTSLNDNNNIKEKGAMVNLEDNNNNSLPLPESSEGEYTTYGLHLDTTHKYRLSIKTGNNEEYLSDFVTVKSNPPIDSINWERDNKGVTLFINTHDPKNNTHYYQWEYNETWEFHSAFATSLKYLKDARENNIGVTKRVQGDPLIYTCWQFDASSSLLLGSSAKLIQDIIHLPLTVIPPASWKLSVLYSILVRQYAWSKEGFEFLERMKKNTESVGSVFDAQPSELNGNIHCTSNPNLPAIGFFNICNIQEKRIFIYNRELPQWGYQQGCREITIENKPDSITRKGAGLLPTGIAQSGPFESIITFFASEALCVDCTLSGTNVKPTYWP